jgi:hypothetical protein
MITGFCLGDGTISTVNGWRLLAHHALDVLSTCSMGAHSDNAFLTLL